MTFQQVGLLNEETELELAATRPTRFGRISQNILGGVVLLSCGIAMGRYHPESLRGSSLDVIGEDISTRSEFEAAYNTYTRGLTPASLSAANSEIYKAGPLVGPPELVALNKWYNDVGTGVDQTWAQHVMTTAFVNVAVPASPAVPAKQTPSHPSHPSHEHGCSTSISSYAEFGRCYSHATAGRPWAQISEVDRWIRGATTPSAGSSNEMTVLWSWYSLHASALEKHDFENSALVHMRSAGLY